MLQNVADQLEEFAKLEAQVKAFLKSLNFTTADINN
jgi:hypothetical protein